MIVVVLVLPIHRGIALYDLFNKVHLSEDLKVFISKWSILCIFFVYLSLFEHQYNFKTNKCEIISSFLNMAVRFELTTS